MLLLNPSRPLLIGITQRAFKLRQNTLSFGTPLVFHILKNRKQINRSNKDRMQTDTNELTCILSENRRQAEQCSI